MIKLLIVLSSAYYWVVSFIITSVVLTCFAAAVFALIWFIETGYIFVVAVAVVLVVISVAIHDEITSADG